MFQHPGETTALCRSVSPTRVSYSRGVYKEPTPGKQRHAISLQFPQQLQYTSTTNRKFNDDNFNILRRQNDHHHHSITTSSPTAVQDKQVALLRSRRWSNPDISAKEKKQRERYQNGGGGGGRINLKLTSVGVDSGRGGGGGGGALDLYDFYENKVNTNSFLIQDVRNKRLKGASNETIEERRQLRKGYAFHTTSSGTESKILEWMQGESKYRRQYLECRATARRQYDDDYDDGGSDTMTTHRPSFSAHPLSRISVHQQQHLQQYQNQRQPSDSSESTLSRKDSFISKLSRRSTLWQQPEFTLADKLRIRNFKWYCKVIKALCGLKIEMQRLSMSKTQQSNVSEFMYISAGASTIPVRPGKHGEEDETQFLLFDKSLFSRTRATSHMPPWAISLMIESPTRRPDDQVHHLKQILMGMKSFRENITENMRHTVAKVVRYTKCDKGRVVLRQGHWGFDFYFIYSGSVFIQLDLKDKKTGQTYPSVENVLKSGEGFGEIALLGDGKRTASVICKEPTELCQIDRETFLEICPAMYNELLEQKINFARQFPIFQFWEYPMLKKLCFLNQVLDIPHSTIIEQDWSESNYAYFVMNGQIKMVKPFNATNIDNASSQERSLGHVDGPNRSKGKKEVVCTKNAHVGVLTAGMNTDLSVLSLEPRKDIEHIIVVSEGVRVFRVSARSLMWVSPRKAVEEYLKKVYKPPTFPSSEEMCARYHINISWAEFKKNVVDTSRLEKSGHLVSNIPATLKGTTGWAKWPGYRLRPKKRMNPLFGKNRLDDLYNEFFDEEYDDNDDVILDDFTALSSATASSAFLDDVSCGVGLNSPRRNNAPVGSSGVVTHVRGEKVTNDHDDNAMAFDTPVYRTAAHLLKPGRDSNNKPLDSRSV